MQRSRQTPTPPTPKQKPRRISRAEKNAKRERWLRWGMGIALGLLVLVLAGGALNEYVLKPNATLARVGNVGITRKDYWKVRAVDLLEQANQYQQFASFVGPDQQGQYLQLAQNAINQIPNVWGSTSTDGATLNQMIDDQLYLQHAKDLGVDVTDQDAQTYLLNRFAPPDAPLSTPPPTPTLTAARAEMATGTALAMFGSPTAAPAQATPVGPGATPLAAVDGGTPATDATPAATPLPPGTPSPDDARATAEAGLKAFEDSFFKDAHLNRDDYLRLVAMPAVARQKVQQHFAEGVGQSAEQVHAAHILVATKDLADQVRQRVTDGGEAFATVARETSIDPETAGNGGDLGWFAREEIAAPVADAAFGQEAGQVSEPVESEYGWHVVETIEKAPDRPLTDGQINRIEQARLDAWIAEQRAATAVSSTLGPTPTPPAGSFVPPVNAPPAPTPTAIPEATPVAQAAPPVAASPEAATPTP